VQLFAQAIEPDFDVLDHWIAFGLRIERFLARAFDGVLEHVVY